MDPFTMLAYAALAGTSLPAAPLLGLAAAPVLLHLLARFGVALLATRPPAG
jgi:hypothetical protein